MDDHLGILQQRIQSVAVGRNGALHQSERVRGKINQQQEENLHGRDDGRSVRRELWIDLVAQPHHQAVG